MMFLYAPTDEGGTVGILGLTTDDLVLLVAGSPAPEIQFEYVMSLGRPLPKSLRVFYGTCQEDVLEQLGQEFPDVDFSIVGQQ